MKNLFELEKQKANLKSQLAQLEEKIKTEQSLYAEKIVFKDNKKTGYLEQDGFKLKMEKKETITWDQEKLRALRIQLTDEVFRPYFKFEWKHADKKALDIFIKTPQGAPLMDAMTIKTTNSFTLEQVG